MPTVPTGPRVPTVGLEPLPGVRVGASAPVEAFGGGAAARTPDLSPLIEEARAHFADEKEKADQVAQTRFGSQLSSLEERLSLMAKQRTGEKAFTAPDDVDKEWQKGTDEIGKGLVDDTQRLAFERMKAMHQVSLNSTVQTHVAEQRKLYDAQQTDSYLTNERNAALASGLPDRISLSIANQQIALTQHLQRIGAPQEKIDEAQGAVASDMHVAFLKQLVDERQLVTARSYLDQHKGEILGSQIGDVEKLVKTGSILGQAQNNFDRIIKTDVDEKGAIDEVRKIGDPEVRQETEALVRQEFAERKTEATARRNALYQEASDAVDRRGRLEDVKPSTWKNLSLSERSDLRSYAKKLSEGTPIKTDLSVWYKLWNAAANPATRDEFAKENLLRYKGLLSESDFKEIVGVQEGLKAKDETAEKKLNGIFTNEQIVDHAIHGAGLGYATQPNAKKEDAAVVNGLRQTINSEVLKLETHAKRPATAEEVTKIANDVLAEHVVSTPGALWGRNTVRKRLDQMGPEDTLILTPNDIPGAERDALRQQLRSRGLPVTNQTMITAYREYLMSLGRGRPR
ncbi:MAG TPA: hypothetical protein VF787_03325 [Thermoanaerobaculia bacterium]